jgi:fluoride exporter
MPDWLNTFVLLALGGGAGANARYWLGAAVKHAHGALAFPWHTFAINVSGSIVLGFVAGLCLNQPDDARKNWYLLLGTGFCGGFTTFSAFSLETLELLQAQRFGAATAYVCGSVAAGLLGVWLALKIAGR